MSSLHEPLPGRLIFSVFAREDALITRALEEAVSAYGEPAAVSPLFPFPDTRHYRGEFGTGLVRRFIVMRRLVGQAVLPQVKHWAMALERRWSAGGRRLINCDPGLLTLERLVLATGKNYSHRIYLGLGVFADLTLLYARGGFRSLEWTYPDYASREVREWWNRSRTELKEALRASGRLGGMAC